MTVRDFFENLYRPLRLRNRAFNTIRLYRRSIKSFGEHLGRDPLLTDFDDDVMCGYLAYLIERKLSAYTVNKERSQLIAIWNFAAKRRYVDRFPTVPPERVPIRAPIAWQLEEFSLLVQACMKLEGFVGDIPAKWWWTALHYVAFDTAERIGAIIQLQWKHVNGNWATFPAESRKGRRADNVRLLADDTLLLLSKLRPHSRTLVFPWPYHAKYLWYKYGKILESANLPNDSKSKFHRIRRTVASYHFAAGGNATELLTHADPRCTLKYLDPRVTAALQPVQLLPRPDAEI